MKAFHQRTAVATVPSSTAQVTPRAQPRQGLGSALGKKRGAGDDNCFEITEQKKSQHKRGLVGEMGKVKDKDPPRPSPTTEGQRHGTPARGRSR